MTWLKAWCFDLVLRDAMLFRSLEMWGIFANVWGLVAIPHHEESSINIVSYWFAEVIQESQQWLGDSTWWTRLAPKLAEWFFTSLWTCGRDTNSRFAIPSSYWAVAPRVNKLFVSCNKDNKHKIFLLCTIVRVKHFHSFFGDCSDGPFIIILIIFPEYSALERVYELTLTWFDRHYILL